MTDPEDPRAQYRQLPERVRPEDAVETTAAEPPPVVEPPLQEAWRTALFGPVP